MPLKQINVGLLKCKLAYVVLPYIQLRSPNIINSFFFSKDDQFFYPTLTNAMATPIKAAHIMQIRNSTGDPILIGNGKDSYMLG